jgi:hybrid polyketide synthase/nonribosomal peptide synthetase ACE1
LKISDANTPSKLWDLLKVPRDLIQPLSAQFNAQGWHHENGKYHGHCNVKESYQLAGDGVHRRFDAQFFGVNTVEANTMDPQMRLLLETVYEALEDAGQPIEGLRGSNTAVYTGLMANSYKQVMERDMDSMGTYHVSGTSRAMMSNRVSYFFDWHGPSM